MKSEAAFIERMERTLARSRRRTSARVDRLRAVVLQSAWRTHKARLRVRNLRETRALGILSVNLKSYVIKRRKHAVATKYQSRVRVHLAARIVRRLFAMRTSALLLQAQWRGIRSRSEIRHLRLVNIVAEGYVEQICLYAMARLYQRRILPQIASGQGRTRVIQRRFNSSLYNFASPDAPKRDGSDATGSRPPARTPAPRATLRESGRSAPLLDTGQGGAARAPSPRARARPRRAASRSATRPRSPRLSRRAKKADDRARPARQGPAKKPDAADEPPPAVKPRKRKTSIFQAPLVAGGMLSMLQAGAGGARAAAPVDAPIIDMTPITASDLILTPATGEAANYAPPPPPFISAEFFDLLNPEEIESLEMMRKQKLAESREETLRSEGSKVMMTRTMARRPSNVGAAGPGLDKDGLDKQKSFRNDRLVSLRKASLHALNFSGRGGLRPGGGRRMSASGLSLSEGGAGGGAPKASAPPRRASVTVDQLKNLEKTSAGNLADSIMNSGRSRRSTIAEGTAKAFGNLTAAAPPPDELLATSVESDAATAAAPAAAPAPAARAAGDAAATRLRRRGFEGPGDDEFEDYVTDRANGGHARDGAGEARAEGRVALARHVAPSDSQSPPAARRPRALRERHAGAVAAPPEVPFAPRASSRNAGILSCAMEPGMDTQTVGSGFASERPDGLADAAPSGRCCTSARSFVPARSTTAA
ncbi:hypothetical protein JL720_6753 [Aureococcus anophagefferens]|nr:hypothetical protein JL720_6753 [Aureococcus anophagefferens]